jgi:uncharacterized protein (TIGR03083 family)
MSDGGAVPTYVDALAADRQEVLALAGRLEPAQWAAESGCAGWSVKDVVAHMGALFWMVVDPSSLPDTGDLPTERAQDALVETRRDWSPEQVVEDYERVSADALPLLAGLSEMEAEIPLSDLGTYPARLVPAAFCFDHYTHLRADLFAPRGPLGGEPPVSDARRLGPALDWVEAALPQQNALDGWPGRLDLVVEGPASRTVEIGPGPARATVVSTAPALVRWITGRADWEEAGVTSSGDPAVLDAARGLHVF